MKLPSAETLREQIASDPDDEPTAGPVEAPEAALTSKKLTRYTPYLNGTAFMGMLKQNETHPEMFGPDHDWTHGPYVLAADADAEVDRLTRERDDAEQRVRDIDALWHGQRDVIAERDRLRAALETATKRFDYIAAGASREIANPVAGAAEARAALSGEPSSHETKARRMTRAEADAMNRAFWRSVEIIDDIDDREEIAPGDARYYRPSEKASVDSCEHVWTWADDPIDEFCKRCGIERSALNGEGFHWRNDIYFERLPGCVEVTYFDQYNNSPQERKWRIPHSEWASIVCSVSSLGETAERWETAQDFHGRSSPVSETDD